MKRSLFILCALVVCIACSSKKNRFSEPAEVNIGELQDRRRTDSLVLYLKSQKVEERRAASLALASVQDTASQIALARLISVTSQDADEETRINSAFALGQIGAPKSISLVHQGVLDPSSFVRRETFEAMGKIARKENLELLTSIPVGDTNSLIGSAWGLYRAGLRSVSDSTSLLTAIQILKTSDQRSARLAIVHFLARAPYQMHAAVAPALIDASKDPDAEIRMAAVSALVKVKEELAIETVTDAITDRDYRVRVSAARALRSQPWSVSKPLYQQLLNDSNVHVNVAAAEVIINVASGADTTALLQWAASARDWRTQATLFECALKLCKSDDAGIPLKQIYDNSTNAYQKAALLTALSQDAANHSFIFQEFTNAQDKVIKSTVANCIARINRSGAFKPEWKEGFAVMYKAMIENGDHGAIIYACGALGDSTLGYKKVVNDYSFLEAAKSKLSLPRDYETYVPLERALNFFKGLPPPAPLKNEYNHPIDWKMAAGIARDQHVMISTSKGDIVMRLFVEEAPGSVVNFVKLVESKYFDGKFFHRVVPNFVIQAGCNRGDGFGSEDYSIRSEFSRRRYKTGSVGMASAGKDTEGTQWFITHSPTPHLDGKYTIFAEVVSGMDVVHRIEVGDKILEAKLIGY
jgi:cyclophilin family peptidyl-prolyl cis-trans isomerase/HEAT repeat protein